MGAIFKLEHANIMAYVTSRSLGPPRLLRRDLSEFLEVLAYRAERYLIPERGFEPWPKRIAIVARASLNRMREATTDDQPIVPPPTVGRLLDNLRSEFADFPLYALALGRDPPLRSLAQEVATAPMYGQLLVLIPEYDVSERNFEVLDPVPAFSGALHAAPDWPGFQFWTQTGVSAFARLDEAEELVYRLRDAIHNGRRRHHTFPPYPSNSGLDHVLREWSKRKARRYRRLLHLSDLHFGTTDSVENQALLDAELREVVENVDRVVITGDLFDTPRKDYATLFTNFKNNITHLAGGREPISITGNHDQRMIGLFGEDYKHVALIGSRKIVVDDQCEMVFVCFNSSEKGSWARGRITKSQFRQLGGDFRTLMSARPELKGYLPIVLVHHHPFSFNTAPETLVQRALAAVGLPDESFLAMVDAEDLHQWCLDWNIKTILHGHKHKARYIERQIGNGREAINLTAIGCGSSLGAEGTPVSYNMLEWDPGTQRWVVSFLESVNGGAFRETIAAVSPQ